MNKNHRKIKSRESPLTAVFTLAFITMDLGKLKGYFFFMIRVKWTPLHG